MKDSELFDKLSTCFGTASSLCELLSRNAMTRESTDATITKLSAELREYEGKIGEVDYTKDADWPHNEEAHDTIRPPVYANPTDGEIVELMSELGEPDVAAADLKAADNDVLAADILRALRTATEPQTIGQIGMVVGAKPDGIRPALTKLIDSGFVVKSGERRGTRYAIQEVEAAE